MNKNERRVVAIGQWIENNASYVGDRDFRIRTELIAALLKSSADEFISDLAQNYRWSIDSIRETTLRQLWHAVNDEQPATSASYMQVIGQHDRSDEQRFWDAAALRVPMMPVTWKLTNQALLAAETAAIFADALLAERRKRWAQ